MSVQEVKQQIEIRLNQLKKFFVDEMELTFIARKPDNDRADFVVTNDSLPELAKVIERMSKQEGVRCEVEELRAQNTKLREALEGLLSDIEGLMSESEGVYGLHLNGDLSPWDELGEGGRFERLSHISIALSALKKGRTLQTESGRKEAHHA